LSDLTWEAKEKVLRVLFAKMNGTSLSKTAERAEKIRDQMVALTKTARDTRLKSGFSQQVQQANAAVSDEEHDFDSHIVTDTISERELPVSESHADDFTTTMDTRSEGISAL
jgi:hypothetical protein